MIQLYRRDPDSDPHPGILWRILHRLRGGFAERWRRSALLWACFSLILQLWLEFIHSFFFSWDGYLANAQCSLLYLRCGIRKGSSGRYDWVRCFIASAFHRARRHTPHLTRCRQQESLAACRPWLMWRLSKNRGNTSEKLSRERLPKNTIVSWMRTLRFPPHLSSNHPRCFVSQELWDLSLVRKLLLQQPHPALQAP